MNNLYSIPIKELGGYMPKISGMFPAVYQLGGSQICGRIVIFFIDLCDWDVGFYRKMHFYYISL